MKSENGKRGLLSLFAAVIMMTAPGCSSDGSGKSGDAAVSSAAPADSQQSAPQSAPEASPDANEVNARVYIEGGEFKVNGESIWFNGMNTPWHHWDDFGGNYSPEWWSELFGEMHSAGMNSARVWLTCSGTVGFQFDENGNISGMTDKFWSDLDSLMEIARENEIYIMGTLISFDHFKNNKSEQWRALVKDSGKIQSFVDNYAVPLVERYKDNPYLWSIDLCNEPDWIYENDECGKLPWENIGELFARSAAAIHKSSDKALVTIGFGVIKYNSDKYEGNYGSDKFLQGCFNDPGAYCDFWSVHYYDWQLPWFSSMFLKTPEEFGLDTSKPFVVGECGSAGIEPKKYARTLSECYQWAYDNGWSGVLPWNQYGTEPDKEFRTYIEEAARYIDRVINNDAAAA